MRKNNFIYLCAFNEYRKNPKGLLQDSVKASCKIDNNTFFKLLTKAEAKGWCTRQDFKWKKSGRSSNVIHLTEKAIKYAARKYNFKLRENHKRLSTSHWCGELLIEEFFRRSGYHEIRTEHYLKGMARRVDVFIREKPESKPSYIEVCFSEPPSSIAEKIRNTDFTTIRSLILVFNTGKERDSFKTEASRIFSKEVLSKVRFKTIADFGGVWSDKMEDKRESNKEEEESDKEDKNGNAKASSKEKKRTAKPKRKTASKTTFNRRKS